MGLNMWAEYYPYEAASTAIGAAPLRPESVEGVLGLKYEEVLYDPTQDKYLNKDEYLQVAEQDPGRTVVVFNPARRDWLPLWLKVPHMVVGSDGMWQNEGLGWDDDPAKFKGHPRTSGTHTTVLRLGRENDVPLMFTLAQLSYWPALHLGGTGLESMKVRGRMQEGMVADIVVFDPQGVREGSTYKGGENGLRRSDCPMSLSAASSSSVTARRRTPCRVFRSATPSKPRAASYHPARSSGWRRSRSTTARSSRRRSSAVKEGGAEAKAPLSTADCVYYLRSIPPRRFGVRAVFKGPGHENATFETRSHPDGLSGLERHVCAGPGQGSREAG
jgi:hypothetical protein